MDELAGSPECETVTLTLERVLLEDDNDMLSQTADAKRYWDEKRAAKAKMPTTLRRTPGVEPADIFVDVRGGPLGSGNFGTVFRGTFKGDQAVVLKNAKSDVLAAEELLECEMEMNYHVHANARDVRAIHGVHRARAQGWRRALQRHAHRGSVVDVGERGRSDGGIAHA